MGGLKCPQGSSDNLPLLPPLPALTHQLKFSRTRGGDEGQAWCEQSSCCVPKSQFSAGALEPGKGRNLASSQQVWQRGGNEKGTQQSPLAPRLCSWRERCLWSLCYLAGILYLSQVPGKHQLGLLHSPRSANYIQLGSSRMSHPAGTTQLTGDNHLPSTRDYNPAALEPAPCPQPQSLWNRHIPCAAYSCLGIGRTAAGAQGSVSLSL